MEADSLPALPRRRHHETISAPVPADQEAWRCALDALPLGVALLDSASSATHWVNAALARMLQQSIGTRELLGCQPFEYLPTVDRTEWPRLAEEARRTPGGAHRHRIQFVDKGTRNIAYWEWSLTPVATSSEASHLMLTVWVVSDIVLNERQLATHGRTARQALRRAEALGRLSQFVNRLVTRQDLLRAITDEAASYFDTPSAAVWLVANGCPDLKLACSQGLAAEQPVIRTSRALAARALAERRPLKATGAEAAALDTPVLSSGARPAALITCPIANEDRAYGVVSVYFDEEREIPQDAANQLSAYADLVALGMLKADLYEEIEQQRRQLQSIFDHAPVSIIYFDPCGTVVTANAAACLRFGKPIEEIIGTGYADFLDGAQPGLFQQAQHGAAYHASHYVYRKPSGEEAICDLSLVPIADRSNAVTGILLLSFDVTELVVARQEADVARSAAEDALEEVRTTQAQMVQLEKMRAIGDLASGVAHDFNNSLMAILGYAELAQMDNQDNPDVAGHLAIIKKAAEDAKRVVQRVQRFARQNVAADLEPADVNSLVQDVVELTRPRWRDAAHKEGKSYDVQTRLHEVPMILAEPSSLREVLMNLVQNALNAMPDGGRLVLSTRGVGHNEVEIEVADSGAGIRPEMKDRIFEPFFTTRAGEGGTGLGLAVSWTIVQRHGGSIQVESEPGLGSRFQIRLPVGQPEAVAARKQSRPPHAPAENLHLLVVDDEPIVSSVLSTILGRHGYRVTVAYSGDEALRRLRTNLHDCSLVLTDHGMPGMNGMQLTAEVKRIRPELCVVLLTGWGDSVLQAHASAVKPDAVLAKPINQADLLTTLSGLLEKLGALNQVARGS